MKLHDVIRTRRQTLGLTQEELARRLGVSAPAVNKWERSIHYPDITLLPSLARVLGVDLNTLLSFQEDMTEEEIGLFLNRIYETAGARGWRRPLPWHGTSCGSFPTATCWPTTPQGC